VALRNHRVRVVSTRWQAASGERMTKTNATDRRPFDAAEYSYSPSRSLHPRKDSRGKKKPSNSADNTWMRRGKENVELCLAELS
jgi:hypothetical protein